jgi:hypothetical protein
MHCSLPTFSFFKQVRLWVSNKVPLWMLGFSHFRGVEGSGGCAGSGGS